MKGAADALCNPETDVRGGSGRWAAGHAGLRGDPSHDVPKILGPPTSTSLQDKWAESGPAFIHKRSRVLEGALPGFNFVEDVGNRGGSRREVRGAKQRRNREVPGLSEARDAPGNPYIGRAATSGGGRGRSRGGVDTSSSSPQASETNGTKVAPRSATEMAVPWKAHLRDSTSWNKKHQPPSRRPL